MTAVVFVDTGAWIALAQTRDSLHARAKASWERIGDLGARSLVRKAISLFRKHARFPSEGVAAPGFVPGVAWSDHWSFRSQGYPAIMVTDTAFMRNPHYHQASDTADTLDFERFAKVTEGLVGAVRRLASSIEP